MSNEAEAFRAWRDQYALIRPTPEEAREWVAEVRDRANAAWEEYHITRREAERLELVRREAVAAAEKAERIAEVAWVRAKDAAGWAVYLRTVGVSV